MQSSILPCYLFPLRPKYLPQHYSQTPSAYISSSIQEIKIHVHSVAVQSGLTTSIFVGGTFCASTKDQVILGTSVQNNKSPAGHGAENSVCGLLVLSLHTTKIKRPHYAAGYL
jgi:hypothetical protein